MIKINWSFLFSLFEKNFCDETMTHINPHQRLTSVKTVKPEEDFNNMILRKK